MIPNIQDLQYLWFKKNFYGLSGINLDDYKDTQMKRRINSFLQTKNMKNFVEFYKALKNDKKFLDDFKNFLTINVTYFFRDIDKWEEFKKNLQLLLSKNKILKIWSAGCSIGCESYTIAILCEEYTDISYSVLATDIDTQALNQIETGIYNAETVKYVRDDILKKYFIKEINGNFKIKENIRENITVHVHDLHNTEFKNDFDIIVCRNVLIYFDDDAKVKLYKAFHNALKQNGILFIGGSEIIFQYEKIGFKNLSMCFYQKVDII